MNITLTIQANDHLELRETIAGLAGIVEITSSTQVVSVPAEVEKTTRTRNRTSPRTETQPDRESEPVSEKQPEATSEPADDSHAPSDDGSSQSIPSVVELRAKAQEKGTTPEGKKAIKALLEEYSSPSISNVPEEHRTAFLARLDEL